QTFDCQSVTIALPGGMTQGNDNTCGPNSAWRVLRAYGGLATYGDLINAAAESSFISEWGLGTTGSTLVGAMNANRRGVGSVTFSLVTKSSLERILDTLRNGKPVVALIRVPGTVHQIIGGTVGDILGDLGVPTSYEDPALHWIAIDGFDD